MLAGRLGLAACGSLSLSLSLLGAVGGDGARFFLFALRLFRTQLCFRRSSAYEDFTSVWPGIFLFQIGMLFQDALDATRDLRR